MQNCLCGCSSNVDRVYTRVFVWSISITKCQHKDTLTFVLVNDTKISAQRSHNTNMQIIYKHLVINIRQETLESQKNRFF